MPTLQQLPDAVSEILCQLHASRQDARELIATARQVSAIARTTRQKTQELRRHLREQLCRAQSLRQHSL